jgi:HD-GYP domain-containing protein (c-di-GMP phosphodiesterase class II)/pSer/pThr/pTyr-binding forkhead associated (FHA) protein
MERTPSDLILSLRTGPLQGTTLPLSVPRLVIGRDLTCHIKLDDPKVSRIHAVIELRGDSIVLRDNNSTNGSMLNGERVERATLKPGDVVTIGVSEIHLLENTDFRSISFTAGESHVHSAVDIADVTLDSVAERVYALVSDDSARHSGEANRLQLEQTRRLLGSIKALFSVTAQMSRLLPVDELLRVIGLSLFEVFDGAENLVILLRDDKEKFIPRHVADRMGRHDLPISVSTTVLNQAVAERRTLIANDVGHDARFKASESIVGFSVKSVICAPLVVADNVLGALYLDNRQTSIIYTKVDAEIVTAFANQAAVALDNCRLCDNLQDSYTQMLQSLVNAIEAKDPYTMGHTQRVKTHALGIATEMGFSKERLRKLGMAADLHDIGKIAIRDGIINKPGSLTDTEYNDIKTHVEIGEKILSPILYLRDLLPWIRSHHERWDGKGYPDGLKGEDCPLEGRILALADAFDAMTSQRSYNKPLSPEEALQRVKGEVGSHFDPEVVNAFEKHFERAFSHVLHPTKDELRTTSRSNITLEVE